MEAQAAAYLVHLTNVLSKIKECSVKKLGLHLGYDDSLSSFAGHSAYLTFSLHPGTLYLILNALCCLGVKY